MTSSLDTMRALVRQKHGDEAGDFFRTSSPSYAKSKLPSGETKETKEGSLPHSSEGGGGGIGSAENLKVSYERNELNERSPPPPDAIDERAGLIEGGVGVPNRWTEGFAVLCSMPSPAGFTPERWHRIIDATGTFIDRWAVRAIECGWSDLDVFGADPGRPDARFDCMGLVLLLDRVEIVGIDEHGADLVTKTGARQRFRRRVMPAATVSLWELAKREGR
jgi:hypothetical protein